MRVFTLLKKELLHLVTTPEAVIMMVLFPIALTWVLGMAFSNMSTEIIDLPDMSIPLVSEQSDFLEVFQDNAKPLGIDFVPMKKSEAQKKLDSGESQNIVLLDRDNIRLVTKDSSKSLEYMMVQMYGSTFAKQVNLINYAMSNAYYPVLEQMEVTRVEMEGISGKPQPNSFDFYGVTMLTLIMMYGSLQSLELLRLEQGQRTNIRLKSSPSSMGGIFFIKVIAAIIVLMVQAALVILINSIFFGVNYGNLLHLAGLLIPYGMFTSSLGVFVYQFTYKMRSPGSVLSIIVNIILFVGGAYFTLNPLESIQNLSPVRWINQGIFKTVFQGMSDHIPALGLRFLIISLVMLVIAGYLFNKRGADYVGID